MAVGKKVSIITPENSLYLPANEAQNIIFERQQKINNDKQAAVEQYNKDLYDIDPKFDSKVYTNNIIIVRLVKDDYLEVTDESERTEGGILVNAPLRKNSKMQVETTGGRLELIDNPVPYLMKGVVCAFDPDIADKATGVFARELKVGATVELLSLSLQDSIYYLDKSKGDSPIPKEDLVAGANPFPNYEGYVMIRPGDIEAFIPKMEF